MYHQSQTEMAQTQTGMNMWDVWENVKKFTQGNSKRKKVFVLKWSAGESQSDVVNVCVCEC